MKITKFYSPIRMLVAISMLSAATMAGAGDFPDNHNIPHGQNVHFDLPPPGGFPPNGPEAMMPPPPMFLHGMKLTDAQEDEVFKLMHQQATTIFDKSRIARKADEELRHMATSGRFDQAKARALANTIAGATADLVLMRMETESRIYALLTPEQRKQAEAHCEDKSHPMAF